jgi:hypothetical protein
MSHAAAYVLVPFNVVFKLKLIYSLITKVKAEIPAECIEADVENNRQNGKTLLYVFGRGSAASHLSQYTYASTFISPIFIDSSTEYFLFQINNQNQLIFISCFGLA